MSFAMLGFFLLKGQEEQGITVPHWFEERSNLEAKKGAISDHDRSSQTDTLSSRLTLCCMYRNMAKWYVLYSLPE